MIQEYRMLHHLTTHPPSTKEGQVLKKLERHMHCWQVKRVAP
jgi:hypothetical protein